MIWAWRKEFITRTDFLRGRKCYHSLSSPAFHHHLTPQTVLTTLQKCTSDLAALSYFLWCAKRPNYFHDKPAFQHMVGVVSNLTRTHGTVEAILQELKRTAGCTTKPQTLLLLMRIYSRGDMYDMVLEVYAEISKFGYFPNTYMRNIFMDVLFKIKRVDLALEVLNDTKSPNFLSFSIAVCNLCRLNEVNHLKTVLRIMLSKGYYLNPHTYPSVLSCFCKSGWFSEALQLLGMMIVLGAPLSVNIWGILIDRLCKSGCIEFAAYVLEKMVKMGCSPNIVTCTSLIKGFLESQNPEKAFEILGSLESKGCFPDLVLCNVLIDCLSKIGWYEDAFQVFSSLRERRLAPDAYTYSSLVSAICSSRQYKLLPFLTSGFPIQPDLVVCNCRLSYLCKSGCPEDAIEFYNDMIEGGFVPDKYSFAGVLSALCRSGKIHEAINVYRGMIRSSSFIDAHIYTIMINGLIKSGGLDLAVRLFKKAASQEESVLDAVPYNAVINGLINDDRVEEACELFKQMKEVDVVPNKQTYNLILCGLCKDRNTAMVQRVMREMLEAKIELSFKTYRSMINVFLYIPRSHSLFHLHRELNDCGLLPKLGRGSIGCSGFKEHRVSSSDDDLSDAVASVG